MSYNTGSQTPANVFRIVLDEQTLLPNNRSQGEASYLEFSELPEGLSFSKSANYREDAVLGRSEPYISYENSSPTRFTFTAKLVATGSPKDRSFYNGIIAGALGLTGRFVANTQQFIGIAGTIASNVAGLSTGADTQEIVDTTFREVTQKVAWLEALTYPQIDDSGITYQPPMVNLMYGQNLLRHGVITNVNFVLRGPWEMQTLLCMVVECNIQFMEVNKVPKGYLNVRNITEPKVETLPTQGFTARKALDNVRSIAGL